MQGEFKKTITKAYWRAEVVEVTLEHLRKALVEAKTNLTMARAILAMMRANLALEKMKRGRDSDG